MGRNLSTLFISQSYQFLTQISGSELQDGLGNTITGSLAITSSKADTATSASFATTASFVLNAVSASFATSASFASTATSASFASTATSASFATTSTSASFATTSTSASFATTASLASNNLLTASVSSNTITFTKGDGTTFPIIVNTGSAVTTNTGSLLVTASISNATTTFTKGDGSTFSLTANNVVNADSASLAATATTASFAQTIANGLSPTFTNATASNVLITGTASVTFLNTTIISSSVIFTSGSNQLGDNPSLDTQTLFGAVKVTGSFASTGSAGFTGGDFKVTDQAHDGEFDVDKVIIKTQTGTQFTGSVSSQNGFTGSLQGTASFATSASFATNALSASFAPASSPFPFTGSADITGSLDVTGSVRIQSTTNDSENLLLTKNTSGGAVYSGRSNSVLYLGVDQGDQRDLITLGAGGAVGFYGFATAGNSPYNFFNTSTGATFRRPLTLSSSLYVSGSLFDSTNSTGSSGQVLSSNASGRLEWTSAGGSINTGSFATTGSNSFNGNQTVTGSVTATTGFTGSLLGTASFATTATSASFATTATSASFASNVGTLTNLTVTDTGSFNGFVVLSQVSASLDFADDTAAAAGGVPLGGLYRSGNFILIRLT